jgi:hypothetical protein
MSHQQFSYQIEQLVALRYPDLLGLDATTFRAALEPLAQYLPTVTTANPDIGSGKASFILVINSPTVSVRRVLPLITLKGKSAIERLHPIQPEQFLPTGIDLPDGQAYLMLDVDRGKETLNVTPDAALEAIISLRRSPLTLEEGVALLTQFPEFLQPNNCFSLLASRCGDKRVPAFWLSEGRPKLGWCWAGNPHTWLGSASCGERSPAVKF